MSQTWSHRKELSFKLTGVGKGEWSDNPVRSSHKLVPTVIGKANEVSLFVNDKQVVALLDTGSMVSTMSISLCSLLKLSIQPLDKVFSIKGAGGHEIPYLGIVEAVIRSAEEDVTSVPVILLVVPDTEYHSRVQNP